MHGPGLDNKSTHFTKASQGRPRAPHAKGRNHLQPAHSRALQLHTRLIRPVNVIHMNSHTLALARSRAHTHRH